VCILFSSTVITLGRGVRRIVTMFEPLENLIDEADARWEEGGEAVARGSSAEERREYVPSAFDTITTDT
jgi:hypothetical protein